MRFFLKKPNKSEQELGLACLILGLVGVGLIYVVPNPFAFVPPCLFKEITKLPCPACGATHAGYFLGHFEFLKSLDANPFFFFFFLGLAITAANGLAGLFTGKRVAVDLSAKERRSIRWTVMLSFPISWVYLLIRSLF
jgi:hypothetical protein